MRKPSDMFDRDVEWSALADFAADTGRGARLGVVSGRRRQGKTYLLRALCEAAGGFYFAAEEATSAESLRHLGTVLAEFLGAPAPLDLPDWRSAVDAILTIGRDRPIPAVIDEFPYLASAEPALPSIIQNALAPRRAEREESRVRLLLCGSAMSFMGRLLSGSAPLRGRAGLELVVPTLDHQLSREFWGIGDPTLALRVHAIVGGTPAYRREFARDDVPAGPDDFDDWVVRTVLNRASPLFREARYLLADEFTQHDTGLYHSVLAAIATGNNARGAIASYLGRKATDLAHPLTVLEDAGLVSREPDAFRANRTRFRIDEPLTSFYHAVMRPIWSDLEHTRDARRLWRRSQRRFTSTVLGPHFERLCRYWLRHLAPDDVLPDAPSAVRSGTVSDPVTRTSHELDLVVFGHDDGAAQPLLALGEAKWGETIGHRHLDRLVRIRELLTRQRRPGAEATVLILCSAAGFTDELRAEATERSDVRLVSADDLYR